MSCVDSSRLCMSGLSLCDLCLCCSIFGSQFSNKYLLTYCLSVPLFQNVFHTTHTHDTVGNRNIYVAGPHVWNNLPADLWLVTQFSALKLQLRTLLFSCCLSAKNYQNWWKFDGSSDKNNFAQFF